MVDQIFIGQAIGKSVPATVLSLSRQVICIMLTMLTFCALMGIDGLLWSGPVSDTLSGVISLAMIKVCWKKIFGEEGRPGKTQV